MLTEGHRYDEIRNLYVDQLAFVWMEDSTMETTRISVDKKIDSFAEGDLEYATEMFSALLEIVNKDGDVTAPSNTSPTVSYSRFSLFPALCRSFYFVQSGPADHEPRLLGLCEYRAHQVDSQRCSL